jgi:biopolymer transport protein ExbB
VGVPRFLVIALLMTTGCRQILGFEPAAARDDASSGDAGLDGPPFVEDTLIPDMTSEGWTLRKPIVIDGEQIAGELAGFPLLVRVSSDLDLASKARADGFDLLFMAADGATKLAHEIEQFDSTTGALVAWVRVPSLMPQADTTIYLYFGNAAAPDQQDAPAVWDSNYLGVWHLGETAGTTIADSTALNRDGTKTGAATPSADTGMIGGGQKFGGTVDGISIGNGDDLDVQTITFETWIQVSACPTDAVRRIVDFTLDFEFSWAIAYPCDAAGQVNDNAVMVDTPQGINVQTPVNSFSANTPHHLVMASNPIEIWIDGVELTLSATAAELLQDNVLTVIGNRQNSADRAVLGTMDEVRISKVHRSQVYVETSHNNQRAGSTMLTLGPTEPAP